MTNITNFDHIVLGEYPMFVSASKFRDAHTCHGFQISIPEYKSLEKHPNIVIAKTKNGAYKYCEYTTIEKSTLKLKAPIRVVMLDKLSKCLDNVQKLRGNFNDKRRET